MMNGDVQKDKSMGYYQSTAWVLIKGAWLYDYLSRVFYYIVHERQLSLIKVAQTAYDEALMRHHPWIL